MNICIGEWKSCGNQIQAGWCCIHGHTLVPCAGKCSLWVRGCTKSLCSANLWIWTWCDIFIFFVWFIDLFVCHIQDSSRHFTEQHVVTTLLPGQSVTVGDSQPTAMASYDTLDVSIHTLFGLHIAVTNHVHTDLMSLLSDFILNSRTYFHTTPHWHVVPQLYEHLVFVL